MSSNKPQQPADNRARQDDATFQLPPGEDLASAGPPEENLGATVQSANFDDAPDDSSSRTLAGAEPPQEVDKTLAAPPSRADATFQMPLDEGDEPGEAAQPESDTWHSQTAQVDNGDNSRTIVGDASNMFDSAQEDEINPDRTIVTDSQYGGAMRSDMSQTINIKSLDDEERSRVEAALRASGSHSGSHTGSKSASASKSASGSRSGTGSKSGFGSDSQAFQLSRGMEGQMFLQPRQIGFGPEDPTQPSDYRIAKTLGEGGMGTVYLAEQMSLDRLVALKVIKPIPEADRAKLEQSRRLEQHEKTRRDQFLSEALVTGALDHPNIVPIHDVGRAPDGSPFYSMKRVEGTAWRDVISKNTLDENLEILLKVADATGFAHARGVVHRDIKPENVMLGEFGVVMLMDWGLALVTPSFPKYASLRQTSGFGGSPAYMAPEMVGRVDDLTATADIYLLGAALYEIITGKPPHPKPGGGLSGWASVRAYLDDIVKLNVITPPAPEHQGELMDIAMKAMATKPTDRYPTTKEFQAAIRGYRSHAESIALASRANIELDKATASKDYADFARALFGYEEALDMWDGNIAAIVGTTITRHGYAEAALEKGDFDLGLSLLDANDADNAPLIQKLKGGLEERASRARRLKIAYRTTMALSVVLVAGGLFSLKLISDAASARKDALLANELKESAQKEAELAVTEKVVAKKEADATVAAAKVRVTEADQLVADARVKVMTFEKQAEVSSQKAAAAEEQAQVAVAAKADAVKAADLAKTEADAARVLANKERKAADDASRLAKAEQYVSQIGLARTRIEQNEFEDARRILETLQKQTPAGKSMDWEWKWLWRQCHQSLSDTTLPAAGRDVSSSGAAGSAFVAFGNGEVQPLEFGASNTVALGKIPAPEGDAVLSALSPDGKLIAAAGKDAVIRLFDATTGASRGELKGHEAGLPIRRLLFVPGDRLLSASDDQTVCLWDVAAGRELARAWHIAPVRDVAAVETPTGLLMVAAVRDLRAGAVSLWNWSPKSGERFELLGEFQEHGAPVTAVALSADGRQVASGDLRGRVLVWRADQVTRQNTQNALRRAVQAMKGNGANNRIQQPERIAEELHDVRQVPGLALTAMTGGRPAHTDEVTRLQFSHDARSLVSSSADYSVKVWNVADGSLRKTLLGHGGGVSSAAFAGDDALRVLSTGADQTVRVWLTSTGDLTPEFRPAASASGLQAHHDEIWSASFDPAGKRILTAGRDHSARIAEFDAATSTFRNVGELKEDVAEPGAGEATFIEGARWVAFSMAVRRDAQRLYVADTEGFVRVWDMTRAVELASVPKTGRNFALALSADGKMLLTGSEDAAIAARLWSLKADGTPGSSPPLDLVGPTGMLSAVAISPDGTRLFTGTLKQTVGVGTVWDAATGKPLATIPRLSSRVNAAAFSPDGTQLFLSNDDAAVLQYDVAKQEVVRTLSLSGYVTDLAISDDGRRLLTVNMVDSPAGAKSKLTLWTLPADNGEPQPQVLVEASYVRKNPPTIDDEVLSARFLPGTTSAVSVHRSHTRRESAIRLWNLLQPTAPVVERVLRTPTSIPAADFATVVGTGANARLLSLHLDAVFQWNLKSLAHELSYRQAAAITEAAFSPDGQTVATASRSVVLWNAESRKATGKLEFPHQGAVTSLNWDPTTPGRFATAGEDGFVRVWMLNDGQLNQKALAAFDAGSPVRRVRWSNGRLLAACDDGAVRVYNVAQPAAPPLVFSTGEKTPLLCAEFSPKGDLILAGSASGVASVWKLDATDRAKPWAQLRGHADAIDAVGFLANLEDASADLRYLTGSRDKSARLWSIQDVSNLTPDEPVRVREVLALRKHDLGVTAVQASPDQHTLMTAGLDGRVILWPTE